MTLSKEQWIAYLETRQEALEPIRFEAPADRWTRELKEYLMASGCVAVGEDAGRLRLILN